MKTRKLLGRDIYENRLVLNQMPPLQHWTAQDILAKPAWKVNMMLHGRIIETELQAAVQAANFLLHEPWEKHVFFFLLSEGVVDMAGVMSKRLLGIQWRRSIPQTNSGHRYEYAEDFSKIVAEEQGFGVTDLMITEIQPPFALSDIKMSRPKIDGVPFRRIGDYLCGTFAINVEHCTISKAEFAHGFFYPIEGNTCKLLGYKVRQHSFREYAEPSEDGLIVLYLGKERRIKRYPSLELICQHGVSGSLQVIDLPFTDAPFIAEIALSPDGPVFIQERTVHPQISLEHLYKVVSLHHFPEWNERSPDAVLSLYHSVLKEKKQNVEYLRYDGQHVICVFADKLHIFPHTLDIDLIRLHLDNAIAQLETGEIFSYLEHHPMVIQASKMTFSTNSGLAVMRDERKDWDFVGGQLEDGENPQQALVREVKEEMNTVITESDISYIHPYVKIENGVLFITYLFEYIGTNELFCSQFTSYASVSTTVPWLPKMVAEVPELTQRDTILREYVGTELFMTRQSDVRTSHRAIEAIKQWAVAYPNMLTDNTHVKKVIFDPVPGIYVFPSMILFDHKRIPVELKLEVIRHLYPPIFPLELLQTLVKGSNWLLCAGALQKMGGYIKNKTVYMYPDDALY